MSDTFRVRHDPIERDPKIRRLVRAAEREARAELVARGWHEGMGFCHLLWGAMARILEENHGIKWRSPAEMNSNIRFD